MLKSETSKKKCKCPYCDISDPKSSPFCGGKETKQHICSECDCEIPRTAKRCPGCGAEIKTASKLKCD